eukprot:11923258-Alexandrium_andersonii.AAC.1
MLKSCKHGFAERRPHFSSSNLPGEHEHNGDKHLVFPGDPRIAQDVLPNGGQGGKGSRDGLGHQRASRDSGAETGAKVHVGRDHTAHDTTGRGDARDSLTTRSDVLRPC